MTTSEPRALIAQYFRDYASWQRQKPSISDDLHIANQTTTADELDAFADFIQSVPERDTRVEALRRLTVLEGDCVVSPGPRFSSALADIRHYREATFDVFLDYLVHVAIDDAINNNRQPVPLLIEDAVAVASREPVAL